MKSSEESQWYDNSLDNRQINRTEQILLAICILFRKGPPFHGSRSSREIKNQNASLSWSYKVIKLLLSAGKWVVAKLQGDKSASQSSMELYYPWISGPLRVSWWFVAFFKDYFWGCFLTPNWKATKEYLNQRGTKIRVFRVCFRAPFLPPFFPHFSPLFPLQALCILAPLLPS